jgi:phage shock protein PspC (stress-responsive transcriptional regulator)
VATWNERSGPSGGLARGRQGRWLGGVCIGLAAVTRQRVGWIRAAFVVGALIGGLGIALYLACWLIIPVAGGGEDHPGPSGAVVLAQACAVCVALAVLAAVGAVATVFGFGWVVVGVAAVILVGVLVGRPALGPAWALLPVAALALPALAVAAGGLRLSTQVDASVAAPATASVMERHMYRSGLNTMLIDLRHTALPASGPVTLRIQAGLRRTIVALPAHRCVHVVLHYDVHPLAARLTALLSARQSIFSDVVLFGRFYDQSSDTLTAPGAQAGPVLHISFSSQGGSLYVRDYPDALNAAIRPDWPGFHVSVEPRPDTRGVPRKAAKRLIRNWRARRAAQQANARLVSALMPGPCGASAPGAPG